MSYLSTRDEPKKEMSLMERANKLKEMGYDPREIDALVQSKKQELEHQQELNTPAEQAWSREPIKTHPQSNKGDRE